MDLKKIFPHAMQARSIKGLIVAILIYAVVNFVGGLALGLLDAIPLVGFVFGIIGWALSIFVSNVVSEIGPYSLISVLNSIISFILFSLCTLLLFSSVLYWILRFTQV